MIETSLNPTLLILAACLLPTFLALAIILGRSLYKSEMKEAYSLCRHFPFEMFALKQQRQWLPLLWVLMGAFLLVSAASAFALVFPFLNGMNGLFSLGLGTFICHFLAEAALLLILVLPARYARAHTALVTAYYCLVAIFSFMGGYFLFLYVGEVYVVVKGLAIFMWVLTLLTAITMLMPGFRKWPQLERHVSPDGEIELVRPRFFILAFGEWLAIFIDALATVTLLVSLALIVLLSR